MRSFRLFAIAIFASMLLSSCGLTSSLFKRKSGCPTNGKNVGAEKLISGDPDGSRAARKAKKFKS